MGFPLSKHSAVAKSSKFFSITSAILSKIFDLSVIDVTPQVGKAACAASSAASTSCASDLGTEHITSLLIGLTLSKYFPDFGLTNLPPIKFPYCSLNGNLTFK